MTYLLHFIFDIDSLSENIHKPILEEVVDVFVDEEDEDGSHQEGSSVEDPERPGGWEEEEVVADKGDNVEN